MNYKDAFQLSDDEIIKYTFIELEKLPNKDLKYLIQILKQSNNNNIFKTFNAYLNLSIIDIPYEIVRKYRTLVRKEKKMLKSEPAPELPKFIDMKAFM